MPGNDLTALRALVPGASDTRATARANLTTLLTSILDDIEPSVTAAQININSNLSFLSGGTRYAADDVAYLGLEDRTTDTTQVASVYVKDDELYFHDGAGNTPFALTSAGSPVAGASGDITGAGYGTGGVVINWNSGTSQFRFKTGTGADDLADLVQTKARFSNTAGTYFATLGAQGAQAADTNFFLPLTVAPSGTYMMTLDSSGNMGHTLTPAVTSLTTTAGVTATGDVSADEYKITGTKVIVRGGPSWISEDTAGYDSSGRCLNNSGATSDCYMPIELTTGDRITNIQVYGQQGSAGTLTAALHTVDDTGTVSSAIASDTSTTSGSIVSLTMSSLTTTVAINASPMIKLSSSGSGQLVAANVEITYDRP